MSDKTSTQQGNHNQFMTRREIANRWRCHTETIKRREKDGTLRAYKLGGTIRYLLVDVERIEKEAIKC